MNASDRKNGTFFNQVPPVLRLSGSNRDFGRNGKRCSRMETFEFARYPPMHARNHIVERRFEAIFHADLENNPIMADALHDFLRVVQIGA